MKKTLLTLMIGLIAGGMLVVGCKKDDKDDKDKETGLPTEVKNFVPDSILTKIKDLGMPINEGNTPPNIENSYLARPFILKASNRPGDPVGMQFYDYRVKFYAQNNEKRTIKCDYVNGSEQGKGLGSYVSGKDGAFTVFSEMDVTNGADSAKIVLILSGTLIEGGIKDLYYANFMLDNYGNLHHNFIENGEGRVIYDSDGMSEKVDGLKSGSFAGDASERLTVSSRKK